MSELLPYELELNQQMIDLPLPDINMAWADMKRRLDDDDKKRVIPFWFTGCAGWGLLGVLLLGLGWWIFRPEKWFRQKQGTEKVNTVIESNNKKENDTAFNKIDTDTTKAFNNSDNLVNKEQNTDTLNKQPEIKTKDPITEDTRTSIKSGQGTVKKLPSTKKEKEKPGEKKIEKEKTEPVTKKDTIQLLIDKKELVQPVKDPVVTKPVPINIDSLHTLQKPTDSLTIIIPRDTTIKKPQEEIAKENKKPKKDSTKKNAMIYSAGIGLHQQLPVNGQKWTPYSSSGRKVSLADYIPSVYLRATKPGKWFLQGEFRYGAPQQSKEFAFRQNAVNDTNSQGQQRVTTTTTTLKKTFYHQVPLSFNYYILPNWSIGAGMQWNHFYSAVVENEVIRRVTGFPSDSSGKFITTIKADSAREFKKSYWLTVLQTQYQWKRFTFGARYSFGLQPYINFTLPGGTPQEEKNNSLQVYLLFELWKSKKK